jgi:biopolymer transport protein ExbD
VKLRQTPPKKARIEIIPMIDVMFFLLVFFMVSSLAMTKLNAVPVALPKTAEGASAMKPRTTITVKLDGSLFVNKASASLDSLGPLLAAAMRDHAEDAVVVSADEGAHYGLVVQAMARARKIGVRKFALATEALGGG